MAADVGVPAAAAAVVGVPAAAAAAAVCEVVGAVAALAASIVSFATAVAVAVLFAVAAAASRDSVDVLNGPSPSSIAATAKQAERLKPLHHHQRRHWCCEKTLRRCRSRQTICLPVPH